MVLPCGFSFASFAQGAWSLLSHLAALLFLLSLGGQTAIPERSRRAMTLSISPAKLSNLIVRDVEKCQFQFAVNLL